MSAETKAATDSPLRCEVVNGELVIAIGVETLAFACTNKDNGSPPVTVVDAALFAHDVATALKDEAEDGTTPVHLMLDKACEAAIEMGSPAVIIDGEPDDY